MQGAVLQEFRDRLFEKKKRLLRSIRKTMGTDAQPEARLGFELVQDNPDRSVDELLKHISAHLQGSRGAELELVESALLKINEGTYGLCELCGSRISIKRLELHPEALCCVACQERLERMDRIEAGRSDHSTHQTSDSYLDDAE